jgi:hypothetical protein
MSLRQIDWTNYWRLVEYHKGVAVRCHEFVKNFEKGTDIYKLITDTERLKAAFQLRVFHTCVHARKS